MPTGTSPRSVRSPCRNLPEESDALKLGSTPARADITWAFLACWLALIYGRSLWLGEPLTIPTHRLQSGALLLFTFFMISDPRTAPDSRGMRLLFAALVALTGWWIQYLQFRTNGLLWALAALAPLVPLLDRFSRAPAFRWRAAPALPLRSAA